MARYFHSEVNINSSWHQVLAAFWQRYPNPHSSHVLTEDILYREVTPSNHLLTRRLLTKTNRLPGWAECVFPAHMARAVYILEDSIVDPHARTLTTKTWNLNHNTLMEFGLARFRNNQAKAMKGLDYALSKIQTEAPSHLHGDQGNSSERHKPLPPQATPTPAQKPKQFV